MDEYLWSKTGSDPEIEQMEAALKSLAYRPAAPPVLPAKQLQFAPPRRSFLRLSLSFAAALLTIAALGSAWMVLRTGRPATQQAAVQSVSEMPVRAIRTEPDTPAVTVPPKISPTTSKSKRRAMSPRPVQSNAIRPQTLVLTKEEADAYQQLMTALSITSTNLKIVKDKLHGTE